MQDRLAPLHLDQLVGQVLLAQALEGKVAAVDGSLLRHEGVGRPGAHGRAGRSGGGGSVGGRVIVVVVREGGEGLDRRKSVVVVWVGVIQHLANEVHAAIATCRQLLGPRTTRASTHIAYVPSPNLLTTSSSPTPLPSPSAVSSKQSLAQPPLPSNQTPTPTLSPSSNTSTSSSPLPPQESCVCVLLGLGLDGAVSKKGSSPVQPSSPSSRPLPDPLVFSLTSFPKWAPIELRLELEREAYLHSPALLCEREAERLTPLPPLMPGFLTRV